MATAVLNFIKRALLTLTLNVFKLLLFLGLFYISARYVRTYPQPVPDSQFVVWTQVADSLGMDDPDELYFYVMILVEFVVAVIAYRAIVTGVMHHLKVRILKTVGNYREESHIPPISPTFDAPAYFYEPSIYRDSGRTPVPKESRKPKRLSARFLKLLKYTLRTVTLQAFQLALFVGIFLFSWNYVHTYPQPMPAGQLRVWSAISSQLGFRDPDKFYLSAMILLKFVVAVLAHQAIIKLCAHYQSRQRQQSGASNGFNR